MKLIIPSDFNFYVIFQKVLFYHKRTLKTELLRWSGMTSNRIQDFKYEILDTGSLHEIKIETKFF